MRSVEDSTRKRMQGATGWEYLLSTPEVLQHPFLSL